MVSVRLTHLTAVVAAASLVASSYSIVRMRRLSAGVASVPAASCSYDDASLRGEIDDLRRSLAMRSPSGGGAMAPDVQAQLAALRAEVAQLRASSPSSGPGRPTTPPPKPGPRVVQFNSPSSAVAVRQLADGSIAVSNSDPALTGQIMTVDALDDQGTVTPMRITVPPPAP